MRTSAATPSAAADPEAAREAWTRLFGLVFAQRGRFVAAAAALDLSPMQAHVLRVLDPAEPRSAGELAGVLGCDASNVTGIVDRLEARGLVQRRGSPVDRRVRMLVLTADGEEARRRLHERVLAPPVELARLSGQDQRALCDILRRAGA